MATWRVMICGINGMPLGFPAGFSIVFGPNLKLLLFNFSSTSQRAKTDKFSSDTLSIFFLLQITLRCAFAVPPLEVHFSFLFLSSFFFYCSIISDLLFPFIFLLLLVLVFLLGFGF